MTARPHIRSNVGSLFDFEESRCEGMIRQGRRWYFGFEEPYPLQADTEDFYQIGSRYLSYYRYWGAQF
jgi:hypothetical protein